MLRRDFFRLLTTICSLLWFSKAEAEELPHADPNDPHTLPWGTFGKEGKGPLRWVKLGDCSTEHLRAILRTQPQITEIYRTGIKQILKDRGVKV
jgi:hypothetical protein